MRRPQRATHACTVDYAVTSQWDGGFQGSVEITDNQTPVSSWQLAFDFADGRKVTQGWNAKWSRSGTTVTATNESWNSAPATGSRITAGFVGTSSTSNTAPTAFTLSGTTCNNIPQQTPPPTPAPSDGTAPALHVSGTELVGSVRGAGARNVVLAGGPCTPTASAGGRRTSPPARSAISPQPGNVHNFNSCSDESCWNATVAPVAAHVPLVAGENTCSQPSLISAYDGTPTAYGTGLRDHLRALNP